MLTLIALCVNPTYLLVDLRASWKDTTVQQPALNVMMYIVAPSKYVGGAIVKGSTEEPLFLCLAVVALPLLDLSAVLALFYSITSEEKIYTPLMIGYCVTTVGLMYIIGIVCRQCGFCELCGVHRRTGGDQSTYSDTVSCASVWVCCVFTSFFFFCALFDGDL